MEGTKMKCPKCQFENREDPKFCNKCGHKFNLTCPDCGQIDPPESKFCSECGINLKPVKETSDEIQETEPQTFPSSEEKPSSDVTPIVGERKHITVLFCIAKFPRSSVAGSPIAASGTSAVSMAATASHFWGE